MATTTNFGWETPDDTDLVKDGAAAMRTLGNAIDTSLVDLKGGTTGQILSKASNTDLDYIWINNDQGDITAVTAGTGITGGGTSGAVTITNDMATKIDAKGDLIVGTAADSYDRLAIGGTNGHVLMVDSTAATGMKWAATSSGGMTSLASGNLTGSSVNLTSISGLYRDLKLYVRNFKPANDNVGLVVRFNNDSNARYWMAGGSVTGGSFSSTSMEMSSGGDNSAADGLIVLNVYDYANTSTWKTIQSIPSTNNATTTTTLNFDARNGVYNQTGAITEINLFPTTGNFTSGTYVLYGVA